MYEVGRGLEECGVREQEAVGDGGHVLPQVWQARYGRTAAPPGCHGSLLLSPPDVCPCRPPRDDAPRITSRKSLELVRQCFKWRREGCSNDIFLASFMEE